MKPLNSSNTHASTPLGTNASLASGCLTSSCNSTTFIGIPNETKENIRNELMENEETNLKINIILESFFEFTRCHSRLVHMALFASEFASNRVIKFCPECNEKQCPFNSSSSAAVNSSSSNMNNDSNDGTITPPNDFSLYKEIYSAYTFECKERSLSRNDMINGTPQFYYTKINIANTDLTSMKEYSLLSSPYMHERLQFGSAYLYFPFISSLNSETETEELQRVFKETCCENIKKYLLEQMKIPRESYVGVTMQKAMLVEKHQLSSYFYEKKQFMKDFLNCDFEKSRLYGNNFHHLESTRNTEDQNLKFELVEISSPEEYSQFWICQSDAFCGVPQISKPLTDLVKQSYTQEISRHDDTVIVGVKAFCPSSNSYEIVSCGELVMGKECASINHVATREGHRNKGYATFIMIALLDIAVNRRGYNKVVLEATGMGIQIYQRLGFSPFFEYYIFELDHKN
ncbi:hypothetical protein C9374_009615 [Naegleria lovaniensis]|uniref:N-acetyltransferase domain-containing protein n=1 Tax=Naegleria lovaniensis TaxID=51637 RepID=A0AA88KPD3_NAELO|nr:uncharacterized protein C9374_009615 [Naegleria lovaniensis]KAG2393038.1 hypothetical protein C9374_009615 [Naegleria lovaniensis]